MYQHSTDGPDGLEQSYLFRVLYEQIELEVFQGIAYHDMYRSKHL